MTPGADKMWRRPWRALFGSAGAAPASDRLSSYRPAALPKGRLFYFLREFDHRDDQRVDEVARWAAERGIAFSSVTPDVLDRVGEAAADGALWVPFPNAETAEEVGPFLSCLRSTPATLPIIFDIKASSDNALNRIIRSLDLPNPMAARHVRPSDTGDLFELKQQYNHKPAPLPPVPVRDVVMLDVHVWEPFAVHMQVMDLLDSFGRQHAAACRQAGCAVKYFLTSFTPLDLYRMTADGIVAAGLSKQHSLNVLAEHLIAPAPSRKDLLTILARTRLLITFHNNLSDMLVADAVAHEIPICLMPASTVSAAGRTLDTPDRADDPDIDAWLRRAESQVLNRLSPKFPELAHDRWQASLGSFDIMDRIFNRVWDRLWAWSGVARDRAVARRVGEG